MLIIVLAVIWGHSCMPPDMSGKESSWVMNIIRPVLGALIGDDNVTMLLVRKLGHFTEYLILGIVIFINVSVRQDECCISSRKHTDAGRLRKRLFCMSVLFAIPAAFLDETIQIFSGRGPAIADVWIDLAGAAAGAGIACLIHMVRRRSGQIQGG